MAGDIGRNKVLENYINDLIGKGYKKKDIKAKLLEGGYDSLIVNKYLYPYASVLMVAGIILVVMIVVFVSVAAYFIISDGANGDGDGVDVSDDDIVADLGLRPVESEFDNLDCQVFFEHPERYEERPDYQEMNEYCENFEMGEGYDCSVVLEEAWNRRCLQEVERFGYFRSEDVWNRAPENEGS